MKFLATQKITFSLINCILATIARAFKFEFIFNFAFVFTGCNPDTVAWAQVPVLQPHLEAGEFHSIQYGDYGWPLLKPTAIVTNLAAWEPEPRVAERSRVKWDDAPSNIKPRWPPLLAAALGDAMEAARR